MSILDNNNSSIPSGAEMAANQLIMMTKNCYQQMVNNFNTGAQVFWNNYRASPSEIATILGPNAKEIFELHGKLGQLLASVKPEAIALGLGVVGNFTTNDDGTVTIND